MHAGFSQCVDGVSEMFPLGQADAQLVARSTQRRGALSLICDLWGKRSCDVVCARLKGGDRQGLS